MARMHVYVNLNSGRPKMWVYSDDSGQTRIAWGSCFSGGHQKSVKAADYGRTTASEKRNNGYDACGDFTFTGDFDAAVDSFWNDLRVAQAGPLSTVADRAAVLQSALEAGNQSASKRNVRSGPSPTVSPPPAAPMKPVAITSVLKTGSKAPASSYDW